MLGIELLYTLQSYNNYETFQQSTIVSLLVAFELTNHKFKSLVKLISTLVNYGFWLLEAFS